MAKRKARAGITSRKNRRTSATLFDEGRHCAEELKSNSSCAQHIPIEILSDIFILSIPTSYAPFVKAATLQQWRTFFSNVFPMNLTGICRAWRQAALCTRALWSTWYMEIHNPSRKALSMLEFFLKWFLRRSRSCTITCCIRFTGTFEVARACNSIRCLLDHQDRWEEVEVSFGKELGENQEFILDPAKLSSLRDLRVDGSFWDCVRILDIGNIPLLSCLRSLKLVNLRALTYVGLIFAASSLAELSIHVSNDIEPDGRFFYPPCVGLWWSTPLPPRTKPLFRSCNC